jgi:hypothetical protein
MPAFQDFSPIAPGFNTPQTSTVALTGQALSTATAGGQAGAASLAGSGSVDGVIKFIQTGISAAALFNSLDAIQDFKSGVTDQAAFNRKVARENADTEIFKIELAAFRGLKRITAQGSAGGFSGSSRSTLAIKNQQQNDADRLEIQVNKNLANTLKEIERIESQGLIQARGAKFNAISSFASSVLGG